MIKKILFLLGVILLGTFISEVLVYNDTIIINTLTYQITTTTSFILFLFFILLFTVFLIFYIFFSILSPNINRINKNRKKLEEKFNEYLNLITEGFIYKNIKNSKEARKKLNKANKIFKETNLSNFLESQILYIDKQYKQAEHYFKKIKNTNINLDLLNLKQNLKEAEKSNNVENIVKYSQLILDIEPVDKEAINNLFKIYINQKKWLEADEILRKGLKINIFNKKDNKNQILFLFTSIGKMFFDNRNFLEAKKYLRKVYKLDSNYIQGTILLIKTYIALGNKFKALNIIYKTWKYNSNPKLADLYFSLQSEQDKNSINIALKLYKINTKSFESNFILARSYYFNELYSKARKYAKLADNIKSTKELYELMLSIEKSDNGSSAIINALKNKISQLKNPCWICNTCKREYYEWQPECNNCKSLNSLNFK